jgi:hypothetical protein
MSPRPFFVHSALLVADVTLLLLFLRHCSLMTTKTFRWRGTLKTFLPQSEDEKKIEIKWNAEESEKRQTRAGEEGEESSVV